MSLQEADLIKELADKILYHRQLYYSGKPVLSDHEFDELENKLRKLDPKHPVLAMVGTSSLAADDKIKHRFPMLSLAKTYVLDDLLKWQGDRELLGSVKLDGNSLSLVYINGKLTEAKTRGNGFEGENVQSKVSWIESCLPKLNWKTIKKFNINDSFIEVRGELCCHEKKFESLSQKMETLGLEKPSNPRNIVAGILGRKHHENLSKYFDFFACDLLGEDGFSPFDKEADKFKFLLELGFLIPEVRKVQTKEQVESYLSFVKNYIDFEPYGADGAVFSINRVEEHRRMGSTSHHPRFKMSFKWQGETATTELLSISWSTSRLGVVTPVAEVKPVTLSGATISNVTLHNVSRVVEHQLKVGDQIEIVRSGEVIPKFLRVVHAKKGQCLVPTHCPSCQFKLLEDGVRLLCSNTACPAQVFRGVLNWIQVVGIEDLSEKRLQLLFDLEKVNKIADLYSLSVKDFLDLPMVKDKLAKKLYATIQSSKSIPLAVFLNGLGIHGAGQSTWKELVDFFGDLETILEADSSAIAEIDGFAEKSAQQIVSGLKLRSRDIKDLIKAGLAPYVELADKKFENNNFKDKTFVLTGTMERPRQSIVDDIIKAGGKVVNAVSSKVDVLIIADPKSKSSKAKKARDLGISLWSEKVFTEKLKF